MLPAVAVPSTAYPAAVAADNPVLWYELDETSGTVAYDSSSSPHNGVYQGGVAFGGPGPITAAVTLDGSSAYISNANVANSPSSFSLDIWFQTTSKAGGLIIGYGNSITGASTNYDRHIYMSNNGQIYFGVALNQTIHSNAQYNDGLWHEATATIGPAGMFLYIDGALAASNTTTTASPQTYSGSWRVGYNSLGGWLAHPSSNYFAGSISQASVYNYQLTPSQVAAHHAMAYNPVAIIHAVLPAGEVAVAYSYTLTPAGGTAPYTWSVSAGSLPAGITLNPGTGVLSGTPTAAGTSAITIQVTDAYAETASETTSLVIAPGLSIEGLIPPLTSSSITLPSGEVGAPYTHTFTATGGTPPYTWSGSAGSLPAGFALGATTGTLTGTPTAAGTFTCTIKVVDSRNGKSTAAISLTIVAAPTLAFAAPPAGEVGAAYSYTLSPAGGAAPCTWSVSAGSLPAGVTLNAATGALSGTPTTAGLASCTVQVADAQGRTSAQAVGLLVAATLALTFGDLPAGEVGAAYAHSLAFTGGVAPYTWSVSAGSLPAGITLDPMIGALSGTPAAAGTSSFTIQVSDALGKTATKAATLAVASAPALGFPAPPAGEAGAAYSSTPTATGGTTPYTWSVNAGTLPAGITLDAKTGILSGTPAKAGTSSFTIQVTDAKARPATQAITLVIVAAPTLDFPAPPAGEVGAGYACAFAVTGGMAPYAWSVSAGALPAGLTLNAGTGVLSGIPVSPGAGGFTIQVTDAKAQADSQAVTLDVAPAPTLTFTSVPPGEVGAAYSDTLIATGGTAPYHWSVSAGTLPDGITLDAATGELSGTPTAASTSNLSVQVTDAKAQTAAQALTLEIAAAPGLDFADPPAGEAGAAYSDALTVTGGTAPYHWSVSAGALPDGITLDAATGELAGTPTTPGTASFTIQVTDAQAKTATRQVSLDVTAATSARAQTATQPVKLAVAAAPSLAFTAQPGGQVGVAYSDALTVTGGTGPCIWTVSAGSLPAGLTLNPGTGVLAGTPTTPGTATFTIQVTDAKARTAARTVSLTVAAPPALTFPLPPAGEIGIGYFCALTATGGTRPYAWAVSAGSLPAGLTLNPGSGVLAGTPAAAGIATFTVQVTDAKGQTAAQAIELTIAAPPTFTFGSPPQGEYDCPYLCPLTVTGGSGRYTWSVAAGSLPPLMRLSPSTGLLYGTPKAAGTFGFTVQVTDSNGLSATQPVSLVIVDVIDLAFARLPDAEVGAAYSYALPVTGGIPPFTWSVTIGAPPAGIKLNPATGVLSGTPTSVGGPVFTVHASDARGMYDDQIALLTVTASPVLAAATPPDADVGAAPPSRSP